jgi:hypothetical protein
LVISGATNQNTVSVCVKPLEQRNNNNKITKSRLILPLINANFEK